MAGATVAEVVSRFLVRRGVDRVYGLQGGHIQPIWHQLAQDGVQIVDVRDEGAAVHMAHAQRELTGAMGVALVTAGPGVTNTVTAVANASVSRIPLIVFGGCAPRPQSNMGPLQGIDHVGLLRPITRQARTLAVADQVLRELDEAWARAEGDRGEPGPVYVEIPTDVLRTVVPPALITEEHLRPKPRRRTLPHPDDVAAAAALVRDAERPAVVSGRGARIGDGTQLVRFLDASGCAYLDTQESRGLVGADHPSVVGAMRSRVMRDADLVITVGRQLDFQLGFGSPAVFPAARFVRIADTASELIDNRRGEVELLADPEAALGALADALEADGGAEREWTAELREEHVRRSEEYRAGLAGTDAGDDGRMHPNRVFGAVDAAGLEDAIVIADGGDFLSFARLALRGSRFLDAGAFGCLGVGVPFAVAAALAHPDRTVLVATGDGAYGINAMEIDTAVRHGARIVVLVANNAAWNIERHDQQENYGHIVGTELADSDYAAMARSFGAHGERVTDPDELPGALERALAAGTAAVIDVVVSRDAPSPDAGKGLGYVPDYQALTPWDDSEIERRQEA